MIDMYCLDNSPPLPTRPLVQDFYPKHIRGHIQHSEHTRGTKLKADPGGFGLGVEVGKSKTFSREGKHIIKGRLIKDQRIVKWAIDENEATKSGIYEQPAFATIVRYDGARGFAMKLGLNATTYGWLSVKGKKSARTIFRTPGNISDQDLAKEDLEEITKMRFSLLGEQAPGGGKLIQSRQEANDAE